MKKSFIVFEGVDFCGKTTQINHAETFLKSKGRDVVRFREPGGTVTGEKIRTMLLEKEKEEIRPKAELLLFFASRVQLLDEKVMPAIKAGKTALLDRYYYSTAAYQGPFLLGYGSGWVTAFAEDWLRLPEPDLVIYLDGDPEKLAFPRSSAKPLQAIALVERRSEEHTSELQSLS
jgi:dTMP kinase